MNTKPNPIASILMLVVGILLWGFSMGSWLAPLAAWIGPVLVMRYARDNKVGRGYLFVLVGSILAVSIGFLGVWWGGMPRSMVPFLAVGIGFLWSLPYLADRLLNGRLPGFSSTLVYPLAATTLEFMFIHFNPLGTWGSTGFTQYGNLPLMQLVSVTGTIGITFLMGWFAAVANWAWENRRHGTEIRKGLIAFGAVLAAVLLFGFVRLNLSQTSKIDETIRVAGITARSASDLGEQIEKLSAPSVTSPVASQELQFHWDTYFEATAREAKAGTRVITWPELSVSAAPSNEESFIAQAQEVAKENGIYLNVPLGINDPETGERLENKSVLIDPSGETVIEHVKYGGHIIEGGRLGDGILKTVATPFGVLSGVICYDMDYPLVIQQSGIKSTGLMLVPSSDWLGIDPVHTHMAVFRAIENGMSVVRQTHGGLSMAVDPYGRVLAQTDFFGATDRTLVAQVPMKHVVTIYTLFGRWLEWLAPISFLFIIVWALIPHRQGESINVIPEGDLS